MRQGLGQYILEGRTPIAVPDEADPGTWSEWFEKADRRVAETKLTKDDAQRYVSTVFIGIDHNFFEAGPPLLFETMIFDIFNPGRAVALDYQERCSTWDEAEQQHARAVAEVIQPPAAASGEQGAL